MMFFQTFDILFRGKQRRFKRVFNTFFLLWLTLTGFVLFIVVNKRRTLTANLSSFQVMPLTSVNENGEGDSCFSQNKLKCEIIQRQRQEKAWKKLYYSKRAQDFEGSIEVDTSADEKKCPELYQIAREMLNGLKVKIPYETKNTKWKFRERVNLNKLKTTHLRWNHPWSQGHSNHTMKLFQRYNVSARSIKRRKILITYGHNCCNESKLRAVNTGINVAKMDYAEALDLSAVSESFQISHKEQLRRRKGAGYWLWKPYILLHALLNKLNDGDLLVYQDAGMYFTNDLGPVLKVCQEVTPSILAFAMTYREQLFSKRDAFVLMGMDHPVVYDKDQTQRLANMIVAMKNCESIQYFMEYLAYTMDFRICGDEPNKMGKPDFPGFRGNRHDQTVHSLLSKKWGILALRDPCTCGRNGFDRKGGYASGPYRDLYRQDRNRS